MRTLKLYTHTHAHTYARARAHTHTLGLLEGAGESALVCVDESGETGGGGARGRERWGGREREGEREESERRESEEEGGREGGKGSISLEFY